MGELLLLSTNRRREALGGGEAVTLLLTQKEPLPEALAQAPVAVTGALGVSVGARTVRVPRMEVVRVEDTLAVAQADGQAVELSVSARALAVEQWLGCGEPVPALAEGERVA